MIDSQKTPPEIVPPPLRPGCSTPVPPALAVAVALRLLAAGCNRVIFLCRRVRGERSAPIQWWQRRPQGDIRRLLFGGAPLRPLATVTVRAGSTGSDERSLSLKATPFTRAICVEIDDGPYRAGI